MLHNSMTLQEMMDYRPVDEDFNQCEPEITGLMRLCIVAQSREKAYDYLRFMMNAPYETFLMNSFKDCMSTVHYDFDGTHFPKPAFILMAEYKMLTDKSDIQALMETVIQDNKDKETQIIADCFMRNDEDHRCLRIYSSDGEARSGLI